MEIREKMFVNEYVDNQDVYAENFSMDEVVLRNVYKGTLLNGSVDNSNFTNNYLFSARNVEFEGTEFNEGFFSAYNCTFENCDFCDVIISLTNCFVKDCTAYNCFITLNSCFTDNFDMSEENRNIVKYV